MIESKIIALVNRRMWSSDWCAYITGHSALFLHNLVAQFPASHTCFTNRRSPRVRERKTPVGRLVFVCVQSDVYSQPLDGSTAPPAQALCDYVYLSRRQGVRPDSLVSFLDLQAIRTPELLECLVRYPLTVRKHVSRLLDGDSGVARLCPDA